MIFAIFTSEALMNGMYKNPEISVDTARKVNLFSSEFSCSDKLVN
jgi:hypothetical protein